MPWGILRNGSTRCSGSNPEYPGTIVKTTVSRLPGILPLLLLAACARPAQTAVPHGSPGPSCGAGADSSVRHLLYFGRNVPGGGVVADSALQAFLAEEVAQRFPDGFTVWEATGHWRGASGVGETERTTIMMVLQPASSDADSLVAAVAHSYKVRFLQEAVLHERAPVCSRFQ
jgi:hypothetical protein